MPELTPIGPFSLEAAAGFGFGPNEGRPAAFDGAFRLAFPLDGGSGYAGAVLRQPEPDGPVAIELELRGSGEETAAVAQIARIVSLDHDGEAFLAVGARDERVARLQAAHPGQRPVLFHSPWEAAAWSIISARRPSAQGARIRAALAEAHGETFELAGVLLHAFPQPAELPPLEAFPGLNQVKLERLAAIAAAAREGALEPSRLQGLGPERTYEELLRLPGIGPFYAGLVTLRAAGFADAMLQSEEPRLAAAVARLYGLPAPPTLGELGELAEAWRPFRTWTAVLIRLAGGRGSF